MERAENQVTGFRSGKGELDRFQVAHFSDHDDVWIFPERTTEGFCEGLGVGMDFALVDLAAFRFENVFDRIFEREDVVFAVFVDEIDKSGERGGFSGTDGTGYEDQSVLITGEGNDAFERKPDFFHGADFIGDDPEGHVVAEPLFNDRGTITAVGVLVGEIDVAVGLEAIPLALFQKGFRQPFGIGSGEWRMIAPDWRKLAEAPPSGWVGSGDMNVGAIIFPSDSEVFVDVIENLVFSHCGFLREY